MVTFVGTLMLIFPLAAASTFVGLSCYRTLR